MSLDLILRLSPDSAVENVTVERFGVMKLDGGAQSE